MPDNYIQWPLNANPNDVFTSDYGKTWVFDGCGWVSTCCPPVIPCDPEIDGISVIYFQKKAGLIYGYGVSHFTWNGNLNRYEGFINVPMIIRWTGSQWRLIRSSDDAVLATSPTTNILEAVWNNLSTWLDGDLGLVQIECGLIYNQLCVDISFLVALPAGTPTIGPFTLYPSLYASIQDIIDGVQADYYVAMDSNGYSLYLEYDSTDLVWYMDDDYGNSWNINAAPNQNALILGSDWLSGGEDANATFIQGACATECYPERDGITLMYLNGNGWTPIYLPWDPVNGYYFSDNQYINHLFGWVSISVQYDGVDNTLKIFVDDGSVPFTAGNAYNGGWEILFNHAWGSSWDIYCGDVGCSRMCATFNGNSTTMVPYGYDSIASLIDCKTNFNGWIGWNGTDEVIDLEWDTIEYVLDIDGNGNQSTGVTSYTSAALIAGSPYNYNQNGVTGTLTLTSGDC